MAGSPRDASEMPQTSQTSLVALLGAVGAFLACYISVYQLPDVLCAGIIFILVAGLVLVLLSHEARMSPLRCTCALLLVAFVGGLLHGLAHNPHQLRAYLFGTETSPTEADLETVLGEAGLANAAAVLRAGGVFNLETMLAVAGEDVDLERLLRLGFPFATAKVFIAKRAKIISSLEYRVRVRKETDNQRLFEAAREYVTTADSFKKMRELIQTGSHPDGYKNKDGWTALIWASCKGHAEVVKFLLDNGANPDVQGFDGWSALLWASHNGYAQVAAMLLDRGAGTDIQGESGGTALTRASDKGHVEIVGQLLARGASTDTQNALGYTALMWACARGHLQVVKMLLEKGARAELRNVDAETALVEAARKGHDKVVRLLLDTGHLRHKDITDAMPIAKGHDKVVNMLEAHARTMTDAGDDGDTPVAKFVPQPRPSKPLS